MSKVCDGKVRGQKFDLGHNKEELPTFTNKNQTTTVKVDGKTTNRKKQEEEERKLMNRIFVASKSVSEIDPPKIFQTMDFRLSPYQYLCQMDLCITPKINLLFSHSQLHTTKRIPAERQSQRRRGRNKQLKAIDNRCHGHCKQNRYNKLNQLKTVLTSHLTYPEESIGMLSNLAK